MAIKSETRLGPYEIVSALGAGGMGEVYRARDARLKREVAIKVLPASFSSDPQRLHRFQQEANASAALNHPNILAVYDIGQQDGSPYIVSELLEGETLRERLRSGPFSVRKAIDYAQQIAHGLAAAHDKGIIHRDLKPENTFITNDGRVKILDFGLAKLTRSDGPGLRTQEILRLRQNLVVLYCMPVTTAPLGAVRVRTRKQISAQHARPPTKPLRKGLRLSTG
jgi:serine/threonine protein kinase